MAENVYEGMFILDSGRYGHDPGAVSDRISTMIQEAGGEMLVSRLWEERRLAYSIKGHRRGTYWLTYFRLDSSRLADVQRQCQLNESILRRLFLKVDPRIVDTLVTHAQAPSGPAVGKDEDTADTAKSDSDQEEGPKATADEDKKPDAPEATD